MGFGKNNKRRRTTQPLTHVFIYNNHLKNTQNININKRAGPKKTIKKINAPWKSLTMYMNASF